MSENCSVRIGCYVSDVKGVFGYKDTKSLLVEIYIKEGETERRSGSFIITVNDNGSLNIHTNIL